MTYGLIINNQDDRVQIDSTYTNLYPTSPTASTAAGGSTTYPPTGYQASDIIIARAPDNTNGGIGGNTYTSNYGTNTPNKWFNGDSNIGFSGCTSIPFYTLRKFNGNIVPATSGMGLEVYDSGGGVLFSATSSNKMFQLMATGNILGTGGSTAALSGSWTSYTDLPNVVYYPSKTGTLTELNKYFCALNPSKSMVIDATSGGGVGFSVHIAIIRAYEYIWTGANQGRIKIHNYIRNNTGTWSPGTADFNYQIYKEMS